MAFLETLGERSGFEACRAVLKDLADVRRQAWTHVAHLRQHLAMATLDARRRSGHEDLYLFQLFRAALHQLDEVAPRVEKALAGRIDPIWIDRYLAERIVPLRKELATIQAGMRRLNPEGFAAECGG